MILVVCALYSFLGNSALLGPSVYISIFSQEFGISQNTASGLISYANLAFGFGESPPTCGIHLRLFWASAPLTRNNSGSLLLVPLYHKFGRRPVMLFSLLSYCAGLIGASQATSYGGLMAARVIHAFGSGVCEALPVQLVNDIFFLHERGQRIGYYTGKPRPPTHVYEYYGSILVFILTTSRNSRSMFRFHWPAICWIYAERRQFMEALLLCRVRLRMRSFYSRLLRGGRDDVPPQADCRSFRRS